MAPSIIDVQFVATMERVIASCLYWKGIQIRDTGQLPNVEIWLKTFEERPSYLATKSDICSIVSATPSQNGPGHLIDEAKGIPSHMWTRWGMGLFFFRLQSSYF